MPERANRMTALRYFLRALSFAAVRGSPIRPRYVGQLAGRAIGGAIVSALMRRR